MNMAMISARSPEKLSKDLEALAAETKRSKGYLITEALQVYVEREAWLLKKIDKAIAAADATDERISQEAMEKWIMSWGTENELPPPEPDTFVTRTST